MEILHALNKMHPYLIGRHFNVQTDHDSLKYFLEQRLSSEEQQKWVTKILGYDFEIIYKKGKKNVVVLHVKISKCRIVPVNCRKCRIFPTSFASVAS
jgi:hypothetical protein